MDQDDVQQFRAEVVAQRNLPTIPAVLGRLMTLVDSESASARELLDVVEQDQALTGRILRLANSAFFGQSRQVATIPRAILLLGFSTVRNLALGVKVWEALAGGVARQRLEALWAHAVVTAVATRHLAARLRVGDPDEAFTAGLLHDVGRIVIAGRFREAYWDVTDGVPPGDGVDAVERATFGVDHAEVAGWLFEAWNLPPLIVEAVRQHHAPSPKPGLPLLLAAANRLLALSDVDAGVMRPEAESVLAQLAEHRVTADLWAEVVAELGDGAAVAFGGRES
jgi:putative nucleotidyltransferase with HDIG domain